MDCEDIALAAGWEGESEQLVQTLVNVGWLEETPDGYRVHEWQQHNEWAAKAEDRSEYFRELAKKRHHSKRNAQSESEQDQNYRNGTPNATHSDPQNGTHSIAPSDPQNGTQATRAAPILSPPIPSLPYPTSPLLSHPLPSAPKEQEEKQEGNAAALASPADHGSKAKAEPSARAPARSQGQANGASKPADSTRVWNAYALAYQDRYGVEPVRNAKVNGQLCQLLTRIPLDEAPAVAGFYLRHNNAYYLQRGHAVDCLLADCEKLRTEWATGRQMTAAQARNLDQRQETASMAERLIEQFRRAGKLTEDPPHAH